MRRGERRAGRRGRVKCRVAPVGKGRVKVLGRERKEWVEGGGGRVRRDIFICSLGVILRVWVVVSVVFGYTGELWWCVGDAGRLGMGALCTCGGVRSHGRWFEVLP